MRSGNQALAAAEPPAASTRGEHAAGGGTVLLVDDEPLLLRSLRRILAADVQDVLVASDADGLEPHLSDPALDVILLDLFLGRASGLDALDRVKRERPEVEVIVMTGHGSVESAVGCMRRGAFDYLEKPFQDVHRVRTTVRKGIERRRLVRRNRELEERLRGRTLLPELVGEAPGMRALGRTIRSLRHNESSVLIEGESGTGKELVARAVHATSPRADGPFVPVDCGALPESIIESELFGHEKGAFTGALGSPGLFRMAHGGTLFLDEIGELPTGVQAKLLRALQQREIRPVGATRSVPVDIRVVAATHRNLQEMVERQSFRADLYYRLDVVKLVVPPLRERIEDVPLLVHHFLAKLARRGATIRGIDEDALEGLAAHAWPGNVRELENAVESAVALASGSRLRRIDVVPSAPGPVLTGPRRSASSVDSLPLSLQAYERSALERAMREASGDAAAAARLLGVGRSTLYRKLARQGLTPGARRRGESAGVSCARVIR